MIRAFNLKKFLSSVAYPVGGGALSAILTSGAMKSYADMSKPPLSPPGWVFPVVWTILYILMGISLYIIRESAISRCQKNDAILKFVIQLILNILWPIWFFSFRFCAFAAVWLVALIISVALMINAFSKISRTAAYIQIPYLLWCIFALYLNIGICVLR